MAALLGTGKEIKDALSFGKGIITGRNEISNIPKYMEASGADFYNNKIARNYGYQSQENSLEYSTAGINKREDSISFWEDAPEQLDWKNTDTYPISVLNIFPENKRLEDLLITNKTGMKFRSDLYGNEFYFVKSVYPKRKAGTAYISEESSTTDTSCTTAAEYYDGLYFNPLLAKK